jgi:PAS domain S-box-containing protein
VRRHLAKSRAAASEYDARLEHALRTAKVAAWYIALDDNAHSWSAALPELMGLPDDTLLDRERLRSAVHPDDIARVRDAFARAIAHKRAFDLEHRFIWPDGSTHWVQVHGNVLLDASGRVCALEGTTRNIDNRKPRENDLAECQRSLESWVSHLPGLLYRCRNDPQWTAEFISEGVEELTGYPREEFLSQRRQYGDVIDPSERERVWNTVQAALAERRAYQITYRIQHASGSSKWAWEQGRGIFGEHGELRYLEGFVMDVTQRRLVEEERLQLERRLQRVQKLEALGTLAGGIAHDFNNVLAAITGNVSLAISELPPTTPALTSLYEIQRSAARATDLVRQILAFSRQDAPHRRPTRIEPIISEAARLLRASVPTLIDIQTECAPDLPVASADPTQIHQVVMNLGVNAAQAIGPRAGVIRFTLDSITSPQDVATAIALPPGRYLRLRVADSGCGMDRATMERIFDPFFTTKPAGQGTGLGLSVVHGIVQTHEGVITVDSTPGVGTTFQVFFPAANDAESAEQAAADAPVVGRGRRVMYVDDESALVFLAQRALTRLGYKVTGIDDPFQAVKAFAAHPHEFDFVVTDLGMPGMSGHDFARELLQIRPDIPVIMTSGYVRMEDVAEAQRVGVRTVVPKPTTMADLVRVIDQALRNGAARPSPAQSEH